MLVLFSSLSSTTSNAQPQPCYAEQSHAMQLFPKGIKYAAQPRSTQSQIFSLDVVRLHFSSLKAVCFLLLWLAVRLQLLLVHRRTKLLLFLDLQYFLQSWPEKESHP